MEMRRDNNVAGAKIAVAYILASCVQRGNWTFLCGMILNLSAKPGQFTEVVKSMVQRGMQYIDETPTQESRLELIETLSYVSAGKLYLEIEMARLTKMLARMREEQGRIQEASDLMQKVSVETCATMAKTEKIGFILEQVRLSLECKNYFGAQILSRKIYPRVFDTDTEQENAIVPADIPNLLELKRMYYELMIRYYSHNNEYLDISRSYMAIYDIPFVKATPEEWVPVLRKICWFLVLAPHEPMQLSLLNATLEDKNLTEVPLLKKLLKQLVTRELIQWTSFWDTYKEEFEKEKSMVGGSLGDISEQDLKLRIIEHNIHVVSKCYSRITTKRFAQLLCLSIEETEKHLCEMVVSKAVVAKIDRPAGIISFQIPKDSNEILNLWAVNTEKLLELVDKSCELINKETMDHETRSSSS